MPDTISITRRLRALFEKRDRLAEKLAIQDEDIGAVIRELCEAEGLAFMRVETARRMVFESEEAAA